MNQYTSIGTFYIAGRGTIKVLHKPSPEPQIGEKIIIDNIVFQVKELEKTLKLLSPPIPGNDIGVVVTKIKDS